MTSTTKTPSRCAWLLVLFLAACGDDDATPTLDAGALGNGDGGGFTSDAGSGELGPTSQVRVANTHPNVAFDAWVADDTGHPVRVAENLTFGTISGYFPAPVNLFSQDPEFVLLPSGEVPSGPNWRIVSGPDRASISVGSLEGANQRASLIVGLDDDTDQVQWETLDESQLPAANLEEANLHISYGLFDIGGGAVIGFGIGSGCFHNGSTNVNQAFSVPASTFDLGIYDNQTTSGCLPSALLTSSPLTVAPGARVLVVTYLDGDAVRIVAAPIESE